MKRILAIAIAVSAVSIFANQMDAQVNGYQFGVGLNQGGCNGLFFRGYEPREQPPFFAKFPPVYYNEIVPRNYGVSPFAAPAGIMPVEGIGSDQGKATHIVNEFYSDENAKGKIKDDNRASRKPLRKKAIEDKGAYRVINPFYAQRVADK